MATFEPVAADPPFFERIGPALPESPVLLAVPHAGRHYAPALLLDAGSQAKRLPALEDRFADLLIDGALRRGATAVIARHARAYLDLNRNPCEVDLATVMGHCYPGAIETNRTRSGLGLIPRRIGNGPEFWRRRFDPDEIRQRISHCHLPYHRAISDSLKAARARFGVAILMDCHSMPPIRRVSAAAPQMVIGDCFGRSTGSLYADIVENLARDHGLTVARNAPYAGGYSIEHHGCPREGIHALQVELDRSLYLDRMLDGPGPGLPAIQALIAAIFDALVNEGLAGPHMNAAE